jgi:SHS2 domain-containing protein
MSPFTILEHPADIGIEARGDDLPAAFGEAAAGMMSLIVDAVSVGTGQSREVAVSASDPEQLLVRWLSEILYLFDAEGFVGREFCVAELTRTTLRATVRGEHLSRPRHTTLLDVKAVTYHQVQVQQNEGGALVRVYFDI